ncbi:BTB/POZ domain-containing protein 1-like [Brevipalpus obovatus]|uniref:BTB/POZ domain-containing protein 1-like n=1 Tax=Brevipalpus obovatus TaxID=246614 RepID=UPI003D9EE5DE
MAAWKIDLVGKMKDLLDREVSLDVVFEFKSRSHQIDHSVSAHKFILMASSSVFEKMFSGSLPEGPKVLIEDPEMDIEDFGEFIFYIYTGEIELNNENVAKQAYMAHKYDVKSLENDCSIFLKQNLTSSNVYEFLQLAYRYNMESLKIDCFQLMTTNADARDVELFLKLSKELVTGVMDYCLTQPQPLAQSDPDFYGYSSKDPLLQEWREYGKNIYGLLGLVNHWFKVNSKEKTGSKKESSTLQR